MYTPDIDARGQVTRSVPDKRRDVGSRLRSFGVSVEESNELAILGGLVGTNGDGLHSLVMGTPVVTAARARQEALISATGLAFVDGLPQLTAEELFARIAVRGIQGTVGVALGSGMSVPITHHVTSVGCEARCELVAIVVIRELCVPPESVRKVWAFSEAIWSGNAADRLLPVAEDGTPLLNEQGSRNRYAWHVASAVRTNRGLLVVDPSIHPSGPVLVDDWHSQLATPNNHLGQRQETPYGQAPQLATPSGIRQLGVFGYAPIQEPATPRLAILDAAQQMNRAWSHYPLPPL